MYLKKSVLCLAVSGVLAIGLSACSGSNPLKEKDTKEVASFLIDASKFAEQDLKLPNARGLDYGRCMQGGKLNGVSCESLYELMASFAKTQAAFKEVSAKSLADKAMFARVKGEYNKQAFNSI